MGSLPDPLPPMNPPASSPAGSLLAERRMADALSRQTRMAGLARAAAVLWARTLKHDTADASWADRDRMVLGTADDATLLRGIGVLTDADQAAPHALPPGQALAVGLGQALAERLLAARFGRSLVDHRCWVLADDTDLDESLAREAGELAGALRLSKLTVISHEADRERTDSLVRRLQGAGWAVNSVAGDDVAQIASALSAAMRSRKPMLIACRTPEAASPQPPEATPEDARLWRAAGSRGTRARRGWLKRLARHPLRPEFDRVIRGSLPDTWPETLAALKAKLVAGSHAPVTGDATLAEMVLTNLPELAGRDVAHGGRRRAFAAAMNGMALHGGVIPCGTAGLTRSDALRPALRLSALARQRVLHVLTDDEPGAPPAMEQLATLRATPNLHVLRPGDPVETVECLDLAARRVDGPSVLAMSSHACPPLRDDAHENRCARGGYVIAEADGPRQATLIASGAELRLALAARGILQTGGIAVAVVSLPCWELFAQQDAAWRNAVLGSAPRFGVESGCGFGWERWLGPDGMFIGLPEAARDFAAAGSCEAACRHIPMTPDGVAGAVCRSVSLHRQSLQETRECP